MDKNHKQVPEPEEGAKAVRTHIALTKYRAMVKHLQAPMVRGFKPYSDAEDHIAHAIIGIADEAGELINILKSHLWYDTTWGAKHIKEELGDLFHYIMYLMIEYDWTLDDIMKANTEKLVTGTKDKKPRYPEGFNVEDALKRRDKKHTCGECKYHSTLVAGGRYCCRGVYKTEVVPNETSACDKFEPKNRPVKQGDKQVKSDKCTRCGGSGKIPETFDDVGGVAGAFVEAAHMRGELMQVCPKCKGEQVNSESSQDKGAYGQIQALEQYRKEIKTVIEGTIAGFTMNSDVAQHLKEGIAMVEEQLKQGKSESSQIRSMVDGRPHPIE